MLETLLTVFLAPLLVNVLSELFKLWIKRRSTLLEGSKKPHRWHGGAFQLYMLEALFSLYAFILTQPLRYFKLLF